MLVALLNRDLTQLVELFSSFGILITQSLKARQSAEKHRYNEAVKTCPNSTANEEKCDTVFSYSSKKPALSSSASSATNVAVPQ
jgi:hypothetical protein